jgi:predicted nucleic acid-binding protein
MPIEYATPVTEEGAVEVLRLLADRGRHRALPVADLIIAALAESAGLVVLHTTRTSISSPKSPLSSSSASSTETADACS